jgi:probable addiction module antidote protein
MNSVFVGGSRQIVRLPEAVKERINKIIDKNLPVFVGDANGADKAVQKHLHENIYRNVSVFCSGSVPRNNLGRWSETHVNAANHEKGFQFYAAKDREMARLADFGLMIWDGESAGTILNVLRLVQAGKTAVLIDLRANQTKTIKHLADWNAFLLQSDPKLVNDLSKRATSAEQQLLTGAQSSLFESRATRGSDLAKNINMALAAGDTKEVMELLGQIARNQGMSNVAKSTGFAREALYRALSKDGNPEFGTVLKVMDTLGLRITVDRQA